MSERLRHCIVLPDDHTEVSLEGIKDVLKHLKSNLTEPDKPKETLVGRHYRDPETQRLLKGLTKTLKDTYLNSRWLGQQTLVEGGVNAEGISPGLVMDGKVNQDFKALVSAQHKRTTEFTHAFERSVPPYFQDIWHCHVDCVKRWEHSKDIQGEQKATLEKIKALKTPTQRIGIKTQTYLHDFQFVAKDDGFYGGVTHAKVVHPERFPSLREKGIVDAANTMLSILKGIDELSEVDYDYHAVMLEQDDAFWDASEQHSTLDKTYAHHVLAANLESRWGLRKDQWVHGYFQLLIALETWIDRSIKS